MTAPSVATRMDPRLRLTLPVPMSRNLIRKPPMKAPAIPIKTVTTQPPGSGPGMTHFAKIPAMAPTITQVITAVIPIFHLPLS